MSTVSGIFSWLLEMKDKGTPACSGIFNVFVITLLSFSKAVFDLLSVVLVNETDVIMSANKRVDEMDRLIENSLIVCEGKDW